MIFPSFFLLICMSHSRWQLSINNNKIWFLWIRVYIWVQWHILYISIFPNISYFRSKRKSLTDSLLYITILLINGYEWSTTAEASTSYSFYYQFFPRNCSNSIYISCHSSHLFNCCLSSTCYTIYQLCYCFRCR